MARFLASLAAAVSLVLGLAAPVDAEEATVPVVVGRHDGTFSVREVPASDVEETLDRLNDDPGVGWAEVDVPMRAVSVEEPSDPLWPEQWGPAKVGAPAAWATTTGSSSVVVAVVDTGVDAGHPDLAGAVLPGNDFVGDGRSGDPNGHGTGVAGVIAARGDDGTGIAGYCWGCLILPVRSLDVKGSGSAASVASGIRWSVDQGADIVNLSLAGDSSSLTLDNAIAYARSRGVLVVAAAGNQTAAGQDLSRVQYPAATDGVIGVVAATADDSVYPWSFRGAWADLAAPGCVTTTSPSGWEPECGTSFASPAVSGLLALGRSAYPQASAAALESALYDSAVPMAGAARGRIDAAGFIDQLALVYGAPRSVLRVAGADRIGTSVALSRTMHSAASTVVIARSDAYADALAAAPLAAKLGAPVLLSPPDGITDELEAEVRRLGATSAWLIGGTGALSATVESGLRRAGVVEVRRVAGASRYDTARLLAHEVPSTTAYVVAADRWPDAVAVSGLAARTGAPILLVDRDRVPDETIQALTGVTEVRAVGGSGVISDAVVTALGASRIAGSTRYETSAMLAAASIAAGADGGREWIATGNDWPDALAAGPASAADGGVLHLVDGRDREAPLPASAGRIVVVGGLASVTTAVFDRLVSQP